MLTLMNLVLLIMKKKAVQSFIVCLEFFFFLLLQFPKTFSYWENYSYADCHFLGRGKGINSDILLFSY